MCGTAETEPKSTCLISNFLPSAHTCGPVTYLITLLSNEACRRLSIAPSLRCPFLLLSLSLREPL